MNSSYGRAFVSIRDDEIAAEAMGVDTTRFKVLSFVISSMFAGIGGSLFGHYTAYLNPNSFTFITSFYLIIMIVIGGLGSIQGSIVGAVLITVVLEAFRSLSEFRLVGFSILLVLVMLYRPQGLMGAGEMFRLKRKASGRKVVNGDSRHQELYEAIRRTGCRPQSEHVAAAGQPLWIDRAEWRG